MEELGPGRELDAKVAEKMGRKVEWICWGRSVYDKELHPTYLVHTGVGNMRRDTCPNYSTDIADAWKVVEFAIGKGFLFRMRRERPGWWDAFFSGMYMYMGRADTAPEAICKAFMELNLDDREGLEEDLDEE